MKRAIGLLLVLTSVLGGLLYWKLEQQRHAEMGPTAGSGVVEGNEVYLMAKIQARVKEVAVEEGAPVAKGQVVVRLDCSDYEAALAQAQAQLDVAKAKARAAEVAVRASGIKIGLARTSILAAKAQKEATEVEHRLVTQREGRLKRLVPAGAVSPDALDHIHGRAEGIEKRLSALQAQIRAARYQTAAARAAKKAALEQLQAASDGIKVAQAAVHRAQLLVDECVIRSPVSGYLEVRAVEPGEVVLPGTKLGLVVDISTVKARFYVPNRELSAVAVGKRVQVRADAYPKQTFSGTIQWIAKEAEFTPRNVQTREDRDRLVYAVTVRIPNPKALLRPGMPVEITVPGTGPHRR